MNTLKKGFIILVSLLFLGVVSVGTQAATTVKGSKNNSSFKKKLTTINDSKSNHYKGKTPKADSINLNSSRSY